MQKESTQQTWGCSSEKGLLARLALGWCPGTWISGVVPLLPNSMAPVSMAPVIMALCTYMVCTDNVLYSEQCSPALLLRVQFGMCLCDQRQMTTLGSKSPMVLLVDNISQVLSYLFAEGTNYVPCDFQGWKRVPGFLLPLSLCWFDLYLFILVSYSCEDDSLVGPPCESLNMGGSWDTPFQHKCGGANFSGCVPPIPLSIDFSWVQQVGDNGGQVRVKLGSFIPPFWPQAVILVMTESLAIPVLAT